LELGAILSPILWFVFLAISMASNAFRTIADTAHELQSEYFIEPERIQRLRLWAELSNALGLAGVAGAAVDFVLRTGYAPWVAAISAAASILIANYLKYIISSAARARFKQIAPPFLGQVAAVMPNDAETPHESLENVVDAVEKAGLIEMDEHQMITGVIHLDQLFVRDIMVPRMDLVALEVNRSFQDALDTVVTHAVSRVPVYAGSMDHIVGVLYGKDLLKAMRDGKADTPIPALLRPAQFVPELQHVGDLLQELQKTKVHLAIVVDEYGGTAGLVTIEDILEEIVGEIQDEYDTGEEPLVERLSDTEAVFNARATIVTVNDELNLNLPDESDTLGGLVLLRLEKMPKPGDQMSVDDVTLTVMSISGRRIHKVRVTKGGAVPAI
jgi:CBS domain containing-hemolysin-like protein